MESNRTLQTQLVHSSFNNTTRADFPHPTKFSLAQSMGGRLVFTHGCYLISNLECGINLFCAGRAGEYLCQFWSEAIDSILSLLPAPNGNVNDVLQIKRPPCKQWPYLCVFMVDCAVGPCRFDTADTVTELWYRRLFHLKQMTNVLNVKCFICINK